MGALNFDPFADLVEANAKHGSGLPEPHRAHPQDSSGAKFSRLASLAGVEGQSQREAAPSPWDASKKQETLDILTEKPIPSVSDESQKRGGTPAKIANLLNYADGAFEERAALIQYGAGVPREWAEGFARLDLAGPPAGCRPQQWRQVIDDGARFLDRWAGEAAAAGWRAVDVFAAHPVAPNANYSLSGLVPLIGGGEVVAISADRATIRRNAGASLTYLRLPMEGAVALWDLDGDDSKRARA